MFVVALYVTAEVRAYRAQQSAVFVREREIQAILAGVSNDKGPLVVYEFIDHMLCPSYGFKP